MFQELNKSNIYVKYVTLFFFSIYTNRHKMVFPDPSQHTSKCIPAPVLKGPIVTRAGPRCGNTGQVNNLAPLKTNTFSD